VEEEVEEEVEGWREEYVDLSLKVALISLSLSLSLSLSTSLSVRKRKEGMISKREGKIKEDEWRKYVFLFPFPSRVSPRAFSELHSTDSPPNIEKEEVNYSRGRKRRRMGEKEEEEEEEEEGREGGRERGREREEKI